MKFARFSVTVILCASLAATTTAGAQVVSAPPAAQTPAEQEAARAAEAARLAAEQDAADASSQAAASVYYKNCAAVRAAGAAPIRRGDPGYARHLDRDGDGQGCAGD